MKIDNIERWRDYSAIQRVRQRRNVVMRKYFVLTFLCAAFTLLTALTAMRDAFIVRAADCGCEHSAECYAPPEEHDCAPDPRCQPVYPLGTVIISAGHAHEEACYGEHNEEDDPICGIEVCEQQTAEIPDEEAGPSGWICGAAELVCAHKYCVAGELCQKLIMPLQISSAAAVELKLEVDSEAALRQAVADHEEAEITLVSDITLVEGALDIPAGKSIALSGSGALIAGGDFDAIEVSGSLTLNGISVTHASGATGRGVYVAGGGELFLSSGEISGNTISGDGNYGGGVHNQGKFVMDGGSIINNDAFYGGGVFSTADSSDIISFVMNGGTISNNKAYSAGGGVMNARGSFLMYNGVISANYTVLFGAGVYIGTPENNINTTVFTMYDGIITGNTVVREGGGVFSRGVFTMYNGLISENQATDEEQISIGGAGAYIEEDSVFYLHGGAIKNNYSNNQGGGMVVFGACTMSGGEISENTARLKGGGVMAGYDILEISGGAICGNTASHAGGLYITYGDVVMSGGEIKDNTAHIHGGGVYVTLDSIFTMNGGHISGNKAPEGYGGGLYNNAVSVINGGKISGNTAAKNGGGVYTANYAKLTVQAGVVFAANKAQAAYDRHPDHDAVYAAQIFATEWTAPFIQGYNNYDINYARAGTELMLVTFDGNGGSFSDDTLMKLHIITPPHTTVGETNMPDDPAREGYTFEGWNTQADGGGELFDENTEVNGDITVYAQWTPVSIISYTVRFVDWDGTLIKSEQVEHGGNATAPPDPRRSGYTFSGWDGVFTNVTEDITIWALYTRNSGGGNTPDADPKPDPEPTPESDPDPEPTPDPGPDTEPTPQPVLNPEPTPHERPDPPANNHKLIPGEDGSFIAMDEDGTPLGEWRWDEESEQWIFEPYIPLGGLPQTADEGLRLYPYLLLCISILGMSVIWRYRRLP